jgi:hypothetical protein
MRVAVLVLIFVATAFMGPSCAGFNDVGRPAGGSAIARARELKKSDVRVEGGGIVTRVLQDDRDGARHQRFVVELSGGQTVLIVHNVDLAPRVEGIREGDTVSFAGEYVWNDKGGLVHWTHDDPSKSRLGGWLKHGSRTYH